MSKRREKVGIVQSRAVIVATFKSTKVIHFTLLHENSHTIWDLGTFFFLNAKPIPCNNDGKICIFRDLRVNAGT